MLRAVLVASVVAFAAGHPLAQQPRTTFHAGTDLVHFGVTVLDKKGNIVNGLTARDFEVVEDGKAQSVDFFAQGSSEQASELHLGLLFDTSESMAQDLETSRSAAIKFLNRFQDARDLTLVDFATEVRVGRFSQDDFPRLVERIRSRGGKGYTALYDAFVLYLTGADENDGRTILVAFTDGGDSRSSLDFSDVVETIRTSRVTIYVVGFLEHQSASSLNEQRLRLTRIAEESGGQAIFPTSMRQIEEAYDRIVAEIRAQYNLGYLSTNTSRDGRWRNVRIRTRPDLKDLRVRTRAGYFAPFEPAR